jgi:geranylgeranyl pyrophosphate synthase
MQLHQAIEPLRQRLERYLASHFDQQAQQPNQPERLQRAMRYALFNGGKRLRPILVYASNQALGGELALADPAAAALESIHCYSLIHDDLPAMDNDELRRGQPTCHIAFDEASAILAGDGLQALAFEFLSRPSQLTAATQLQMIQLLAQACGSSSAALQEGMVAGQALDIAAEGQQQSLDQLERMHRCKTGALIKAAVQLGALSSGHCQPQQLDQLGRYAEAVGLAFQIQDDILDIEGDTQTLGKPQGSDLARDKSTYPALLGLDGAKRKATELHQQALEALDGLPQDTRLLRLIADYIITRDH